MDENMSNLIKMRKNKIELGDIEVSKTNHDLVQSGFVLVKQ